MTWLPWRRRAADQQSLTGLRKDPNDRPLPGWNLIDIRNDRHCWQRVCPDGRVETISGGTSTGWTIEVVTADGRTLDDGPYEQGVAEAMCAAMTMR